MTPSLEAILDDPFLVLCDLEDEEPGVLAWAYERSETL